jgi:hypothetical protein
VNSSSLAISCATLPKTRGGRKSYREILKAVTSNERQVTSKDKAV